jgi:hypothetical protein
MTVSTIDCICTELVVCPHCGTKDECGYEFFNVSDDTEATCPECDREFLVSRQVETTYSSRVKP